MGPQTADPIAGASVTEKGLDLSKFEVLLPDARVERIAERLREKFGRAKLEGVVFVSFIQPAKEVPVRTPAGVVVQVTNPPVAVFGAIARDPRKWRKPTDFLMGAASTDLQTFRSAERERAHYVSGDQDAAWQPFVGATVALLRDLKSAREQVTDVPMRN